MHPEHHHGEQDHHARDLRNLKWVFFINLAFAGLELGGGMWTNSMAILSDALHDFGDSLSLGLAWYFQRLSRKQKDARFSYGYGRFSIMGAVTNSLILAVGSVLILREAIPKLWEPGTPHAEGMMYLAILGLIFNGIAFKMLSRGESLNEKVASLHLLEDVLGWVAVLVGAIIMIFYPLPIIDPILSIGIALFILFNVYRNLRTAFTIFLQGTPDGIELSQIESGILALEPVREIHDLHAWTMDGRFHILTTHIVVKSSLPMEEVVALKEKVREVARNMKINHVTIEVEAPEEDCMHEDNPDIDFDPHHHGHSH